MRQIRMLRLMRRELETALRNGLRHRQRAKAAGKQRFPIPTVIAPVLDPTPYPRQTGIDRTVIGDKARRFVTDGMLGLKDDRSEPRLTDRPIYPEGIAGYIIYLKQRYPPIHLREIARILLRKFGYKTNHHTLKRFLEPYETPLQLALDLTTFSSFDDAYHAR